METPHTLTGIENDTHQLRGAHPLSPRNKASAHIGIENDTQHTKGTPTALTGIENDTQHTKGDIRSSHGYRKRYPAHQWKLPIHS